jgi:alanine dehydrogenase
MRIGVPRETKTLEGRVALVPAAAGDLVRRGHEVWLEKDAGVKSGFKDSDYTGLGVKIAPDAAGLYEKGELIVKVKEPIAGDLQHLRKDHLLFCYLHLAAEPKLTRQLLDIGLCGVAFETVEMENGDLPLLAPMSVIAGQDRGTGRHPPAAPARRRQGQAARRPAVDRTRQGRGVRRRQGG